ncbi:hypothetical protein SCRES3_gp40 [Synechococcus phage S-CRES3]|nr:hypothetical protein SCRES3_gp40 [Synechococcus phage S-CRES3]
MTIKKDLKGSGTIDWTAIFKRRPDLEPPGYHETVAKLYSRKEQPNGKAS